MFQVYIEITNRRDRQDRCEWKNNVTVWMLRSEHRIFHDVELMEEGDARETNESGRALHLPADRKSLSIRLHIKHCHLFRRHGVPGEKTCCHSVVTGSFTLYLFLGVILRLPNMCFPVLAKGYTSELCRKAGWNWYEKWFLFCSAWYKETE